ncbi:MAG: AarF/UbiB family protein, partial [Oscillospiraceae bacterium]|nr:AarF/UbiB family protein [Oscillospiraceae bacterium]
MSDTQLTQTPKPKRERSSRLKEILVILNKHDIIHGLTPEKLRKIVEDLGPTYIKLGQILSMRPDILPKDYCKELANLRSQVKPMEYPQVRRIVEDSLGTTLENVFLEFDETAMGSASIAQAHRAKLNDGTAVVVKVQREGIRETMSKDITLLRRAAGILKLASGTGDVIDFRMVLDEMWSVTQEEMDFLTEAHNAEHFFQLNKDVAYVTSPKIYRQYTTSKVLTMECIDGIGIGDHEKLLAAGYDLNDMGGKLAHNFFKQIIEDGFFHADPHQGNILVRDGKIVWIDLGMMGRLTARDQRLFGKIISAVAGQDVNAVKELLLTMGHTRGTIDHVHLYTDIDELLARYGDMDLAAINLATVLEDIVDMCKANDISMPQGFSMVARGVATLEGVVAELSPEINVMQVAAGLMSEDVLGNIDWRRELRCSARTIRDSGRKAMELPALVADFLRMGIKGQQKWNMELNASPA